jgi:hypothetical protein
MTFADAASLLEDISELTAAASTGGSPWQAVTITDRARTVAARRP